MVFCVFAGRLTKLKVMPPNFAFNSFPCAADSGCVVLVLVRLFTTKSLIAILFVVPPLVSFASTSVELTVEVEGKSFICMVSPLM